MHCECMTIRYFFRSDEKDSSENTIKIQLCMSEMRQDVRSTSCLHADARPCDYQVDSFFSSDYVTGSSFASRLNTIQLISVWSCLVRIDQDAEQQQEEEEEEEESMLNIDKNKTEKFASKTMMMMMMMMFILQTYIQTWCDVWENLFSYDVFDSLFLVVV